MTLGLPVSHVPPELPSRAGDSQLPSPLKKFVPDMGTSWVLGADEYLREVFFLPLSQSCPLPETWPPRFLKGPRDVVSSPALGEEATNP